MKPIIKLNLILLFFAFVIISCEKNINSGKMKVYMTDDIIPTSTYEHVYIDLEKISIHYLGSQGDSWIDLPTNSGIYDLPTLSDDITIAITDEGSIPIGKVSQIRFKLGNNNSVVVSGVTSPLKIPSAYTSGVKIQVNQEIRRTQKISIILDFDADQSINMNGVGEYIMNPVIKVKSVSYY